MSFIIQHFVSCISAETLLSQNSNDQRLECVLTPSFEAYRHKLSPYNNYRHRLLLSSSIFMCSLSLNRVWYVESNLLIILAGIEHDRGNDAVNGYAITKYVLFLRPFNRKTGRQD